METNGIQRDQIIGGVKCVQEKEKKQQEIEQQQIEEEELVKEEKASKKKQKKKNQTAAQKVVENTNNDDDDDDLEAQETLDLLQQNDYLDNGDDDGFEDEDDEMYVPGAGLYENEEDEEEAGFLQFGNMPEDEVALMKAMYPELPEYFFMNPKERKKYFNKLNKDYLKRLSSAKIKNTKQKKKVNIALQNSQIFKFNKFNQVGTKKVKVNSDSEGQKANKGVLKRKSAYL
eukprot:TRINITY_DN2894_c0_g1_i3.p1 TRINITY_DN2894_c0_g1~~TRINITY_DN2894_c0_g1_i3.p1  ORF type:complete len:230 (-),score=72.59 TRINITY_DN2894_c0_g1_i3:86-775(-)